MRHFLLHKRSKIDFTDAELRAIDTQLRDSHWSNVQLRGPHQLGPEVTSHTKELDSALVKTPPLHKMVVYRAIPNSALTDGPISSRASDGLNPGSVFQDKGYVSTSKNRKVVNHPGYVHPDDRLVLHITIPSGTHALDIHEIVQNSANPKAIELASWEEELLLPRGQIYQIEKFDKKSKMLYVILLS